MNSVVHTGVKLAGWQNSMVQLPSKAAMDRSPFDERAEKSGARLPIIECGALCCGSISIFDPAISFFFGVLEEISRRDTGNKPNVQPTLCLVKGITRNQTQKTAIRTDSGVRIFPDIGCGGRI